MRSNCAVPPRYGVFTLWRLPGKLIIIRHEKQAPIPSTTIACSTPAARETNRREDETKKDIPIMSYLSGFIGKRELATWAIATGIFTALIACQFSLWSLVGVAVLFIGYASWTTTKFMMTTHYSGSNVVACVWPVSIAIIQALLGLGLAWVMVWLGNGVFRS